MPPSTSPIPAPSAAPSATGTRLVDVRAEVRRTHAGVLFFYVVDALLLGLLGISGTVPLTLCMWYAVAGCASVELAFFAFHRLDRLDGLDRLAGEQGRRLQALALGLAATSGVVMLATMACAPQVGGLMLMSMMAVLALSAVQLPRRHLLALCVLLAGGSVAVLALTGGSAGVPMASVPERVLSGVWLAWLMAKASAHNIAGTRLRDQVRSANAELAQALQRLERVAATDELTSLPNRRAILAGVERAVAAAQRHGRPVGIALLDIDRFKRINDSRGHAVGDQVLQGFGRLVSLSLRPSDQLGRYGGEEFLLVLQEFGEADAAADVVQRLCACIAAHDWAHVAPGLAVTVSAGVALLLPGEAGAAAIRRADAALYQAKDSGRNRVVMARDSPVANASPSLHVQPGMSVS